MNEGTTDTSMVGCKYNSCHIPSTLDIEMIPLTKQPTIWVSCGRALFVPKNVIVVTVIY